MPTMNYYVSKGDQEEIEKARELLGDDYSPFIVRSLKSVVYEADKREKSLVEVSLFEGKEQMDVGIRQGRDVKFIGKQISPRVCFDDSTIPYWYELYLTRKGKFLLYLFHVDSENAVTTYSYKIYETFRELQQQNVPGALLVNAQNNMPDIGCEFLDI